MYLAQVQCKLVNSLRGICRNKLFTSVNQPESPERGESAKVDKSSQQQAQSNQPDAFDEYDKLYQSFQDSKRDRDELQRELQRLRDQKELAKMRESSLGGQPAHPEVPKEQSGF
jgi:predicted  nucleic acid-binding Zn-ribbon protein